MRGPKSNSSRGRPSFKERDEFATGYKAPRWRRDRLGVAVCAGPPKTALEAPDSGVAGSKFWDEFSFPNLSHPSPNPSQTCPGPKGPGTSLDELGFGSRPGRVRTSWTSWTSSAPLVTFHYISFEVTSVKPMYSLRSP